MIHSRDITTEAEAAVLEHADRLAAVIGKHWHPTDDTARDDVMLLVADLLRAHAETGIEMQTWRAALDVVLDHLAAEPEGADLLHRLGRPAWFTVIGTTKDGQREPVAVLPGRCRPEVAIGAWSTQVQAPTAAKKNHILTDRIATCTLDSNKTRFTSLKMDFKLEHFRRY